MDEMSRIAKQVKELEGEQRKQLREDDELGMQLEKRLKHAEEQREYHALERERFNRVSRACRAGLNALSEAASDVDVEAPAQHHGY